MEKRVGEVVYRYLGQEDTAMSQFSCSNKCTYAKVVATRIYLQYTTKNYKLIFYIF